MKNTLSQLNLTDLFVPVAWTTKSVFERQAMTDSEGNTYVRHIGYINPDGILVLGVEQIMKMDPETEVKLIQLEVKSR